MKWPKLVKDAAYLVTWQDICNYNAWYGEDEAASKSLALCVSLGFLVNMDKDVIRLSQSRLGYIDDGTERDVLVIPRSVVLSIERLSIDKKWTIRKP